MKEKKNEIVLVVGIVLGVTMILIGSFYWFKSKDQKPVDTNPVETNTDNNEEETNIIDNNENNEEIDNSQNEEETENEEPVVQKDITYNPVDFDKVIDNNGTKKLSYKTYDNLPKKITIATNAEYYVLLSDNGKVSVSSDNSSWHELTNITDAKSIICFFESDGNVYIMLNNGDVYRYNINKQNQNNYNAEKINAISNAVNFAGVNTNDNGEVLHAGDEASYGVLDSNNKYIEIENYRE